MSSMMSYYKRQELGTFHYWFWIYYLWIQRRDVSRHHLYLNVKEIETFLSANHTGKQMSQQILKIKQRRLKYVFTGHVINFNQSCSWFQIYVPYWVV